MTAPNRRFTPEEDMILRAAYAANTPIKTLQTVLDRSRDSIFGRASYLGIQNKHSPVPITKRCAYCATGVVRKTVHMSEKKFIEQKFCSPKCYANSREGNDFQPKFCAKPAAPLVGNCFEDDPRAVADTGSRFMPTRPLHHQSIVGCSALRCTTSGPA